MEAVQSIDFSSPRRQSKVAMGIILIKFLKNTIRVMWPVFLSYFIGARSSSYFEDIIGYIAIGFGAFNLIGLYLPISVFSSTWKKTPL